MDNEKIYEIIKQLMIVIKLMNRKVSHKMDSKKINMSSAMIFHQLENGESKTLSDISEALALPNSTASMLVDRLVKKGLLKRIRDEKDRRRVLIFITDEALKKKKEIEVIHMECFREMLKPASEEEVDTIIKGLRILGTLVEERDERSEYRV